MSGVLSSPRLSPDERRRIFEALAILERIGALD
jgi:hypothetical protein